MSRSQGSRWATCAGHTKGHIALHFGEQQVAFVGDALFAMGCGRMFEGTYPQMFQVVYAPSPACLPPAACRLPPAACRLSARPPVRRALA